MSVSKTSQAVAVTRAGFARPNSRLGDPLAQRRLCAGMRSVVLTDMQAALAARTAFFDGQVTTAIAAGTRQIVILGAGYDDRALRFRTPDVTFFELDHPDTQSDKRSRLAAILAEDGEVPAAGLVSGAPQAARPRPESARLAEPAGPVLAAADFARDDVAGVLAQAGHQASVPTLFVCEGLLVYLDKPSTVRFLTGVRAAAAPGSVLAASLAIHADGLDSRAVLARANARRRTAAAEPWLTILPAVAQADLLARAGWQVTEMFDAADFGTGADPGRSLLMTARPAGGSGGSSPRADTAGGSGGSSPRADTAG